MFDCLNENEIKEIFIKIKKINNNYFSNRYFRYFLDNDIKNDKVDNKSNFLYCIPKVRYEKGKIIFIYRKEKIQIEIERILNLILDNKMFINKEEKEILKQAYFCETHNKEYKSCCYCDNDICEDCSKDHFLHKGSIIKKEINENDIKKLKEKIINYNNYYKSIKSRNTQIIISFGDVRNNYYNDDFKNSFKKKINFKFSKMERLLAYHIYINIINALILEYQENETKYFNHNIFENLSCALEEIIKEPKKKKIR